MKAKVFFLILAAAFIVPYNAQAQLGSKLKKKLEEAVTKAAGKDSTQQADRTVGEDAQENAGPRFSLPNLGIGKVTATYDENYDFRGLIKMRSELYEKGKQENVLDISMWFNAEMGNIGMESSSVTTQEGQTGNAVAIIDSKNRVMITVAVVDGNKSGIIMPIPDTLAADAVNQPSTAEEDITVRKTGGTRTICGYKCEEYEITEEKGRLVSHHWITDELKFKGNKKLLSGQQGMPASYGKIKSDGSEMASDTYEKGVLTSKSEVTEVDLNATHSISVAGVSLIQMDMSKWLQKKR